MIVCDKNAGLAVDAAQLWKGTLSEPAEDGEDIVVNMMIEDDMETLLIEWNQGTTNTKLYVPLERLQKILAEI